MMEGFHSGTRDLIRQTHPTTPPRSGVRLRFVGHALTDLFPDIRTAPVGAGLYRSLYRSMSISAHRNTESRHHGSGWVWRQGSQETQADGSSR